MTEDDQHLRWLSVGHYALSAFVAFLFLVFGLFFGFTSWLVFHPDGFPHSGQEQPSPMFVLVFTVGMMALTFVSWIAMAQSGAD